MTTLPIRPDQARSVLYYAGPLVARADGVAYTSAATDVTGGFTANGGTAVTIQSTFTGGTGSSTYTIGDIVAALKNLGLIPA